MVTKELVDFVKAEVKAGKPIESIKSELLATGWQEQDVTEACNQVKTGHHKGGLLDKLPFASGHFLMFGGIFAVVLLIGIFALTLALNSSKKQTTTTNSSKPTTAPKKTIVTPTAAPSLQPTGASTQTTPTVTVCPPGLKACHVKSADSCPATSPFACTNGVQNLCCENPQ